MDEMDEKTDKGCFFCDQHLDNGVRLEIWPSEPDGRYEVTMTLAIAKARWWQRWRSDPPLPERRRQDFLEALDRASTWLGNKGNYHPCCLRLRVSFLQSDDS